MGADIVRRSGHRRTARRRCRRAWTSVSSSTRAAKPASRSATATPGLGTRRQLLRPARRRRRASRASSRSPRATCEPATGSGSAGSLRGRRGAARSSSSWSGSMFEYLMPEPRHAQPPGPACCRRRRTSSCGRARSRTATQHGIPWGISESAYNARDIEHTYQYSSLRRPRSRARAWARGRPRHRAVRDRSGGDGRPEGGRPQPRSSHRRGGARALRLSRGPRLHAARLPESAPVAVVNAYMAHHQGMTVVAIGERRRGGRHGRAPARRADRPGHRAAAPGAHAT